MCCIKNNALFFNWKIVLPPLKWRYINSQWTKKKFIEFLCNKLLSYIDNFHAPAVIGNCNCQVYPCTCFKNQAKYNKRFIFQRIYSGRFIERCLSYFNKMASQSRFWVDPRFSWKKNSLVLWIFYDMINIHLSTHLTVFNKMWPDDTCSSSYSLSKPWTKTRLTSKSLPHQL